MSNFDRTRNKTKRSQKKRKDMPSAEVVLWTFIKNRRLGDFKFRRQHPIGSFFLDFYCPEIKLCIELDGDQHGFDHARAKDDKRTSYLESHGICVIRFWNDEVYKNINGVLDSILEQATYLRRERELFDE